jgi:hypothetical protein
MAHSRVTGSYGVQTGGAHHQGGLARDVGIFLGQSPERVIDVGQQFVGGHFHVGERAYGGAEPAHVRGGVDAVPDHVADDESPPGAGQRDHIEPVAPDAGVDVGGQVARGRLDRDAAPQTAREQVALEGEGRGVFTGVLASVVQGQRGSSDELLGEQQVVLLERQGGLGAEEQRDTQDGAPRTDGHDDQGVRPVLADLLRPYRVVVDPCPRGGVQYRFQVGPSRAQDPGERRGRGDENRVPQREHRLWDPWADRGLTGTEEDGRATAQQVEPGRGLFAERDGFRQVDGGVVGQHGHGEVGQFLPGLHDVQGAADTRTDLSEDGKALAYPPAAGAVNADAANPQRLAVRVLEIRGRERVPPVRIFRRPRPVLGPRWCRSAAPGASPPHGLRPRSRAVHR